MTKVIPATQVIMNMDNSSVSNLTVSTGLVEFFTIRFIMLACMSVLVAVAVTLNIVVLTVSHLGKCVSQNHSTIFVIALSVTDVISALASVPSLIYRWTLLFNPYDEISTRYLYCLVCRTLIAACTQSALCILLAISIMQYAAIGYPVFYKVWIDKRRILYICVALATVPIGNVFLYVYLHKYTGYYVTICDLKEVFQENANIMKTFNLIFYWSLSILVVLITTLTFLKVRKKTRKVCVINGNLDNTTDLTCQNRNKMTNVSVSANEESCPTSQTCATEIQLHLKKSSSFDFCTGSNTNARNSNQSTSNHNLNVGGEESPEHYRKQSYIVQTSLLSRDSQINGKMCCSKTLDNDTWGRKVSSLPINRRSVKGQKDPKTARPARLLEPLQETDEQCHSLVHDSIVSINKIIPFLPIQTSARDDNVGQETSSTDCSPGRRDHVVSRLTNQRNRLASNFLNNNNVTSRLISERNGMSSRHRNGMSSRHRPGSVKSKIHPERHVKVSLPNEPVTSPDRREANSNDQMEPISGKVLTEPTSRSDTQNDLPMSYNITGRHTGSSRLGTGPNTLTVIVSDHDNTSPPPPPVNISRHYWKPYVTLLLVNVGYVLVYGPVITIRTFEKLYPGFAESVEYWIEDFAYVFLLIGAFVHPLIYAFRVSVFRAYLRQTSIFRRCVRSV